MLKRAVFLVSVFSAFSFLTTSCDKDDDNPIGSSSFRVTITNAFVVSGSSTNKPVDESKRSGFDLVLSSVIDDSSTRLLTGAY